MSGMSPRRDADALAHPRIDDEWIVDRYLAGRLPPEEEARFEEHLFECTECLEQVEAGEELRRGLHAVAAEDAARTTAREGLAALGLVTWLRRRRPVELAGLALLVLALISLPAVVLWQQAEPSRLRGASRLAPGGLTEPTADLQVVSLGVVRDAEGTAQIRLGPEKEVILFSLELPVGAASRHRVTLRNAEGEILWAEDGLEPNLYDTLLVAVPSSYLAPGSYRIMVEDLSVAGTEPTAEMAFRLLAGE